MSGPRGILARARRRLPIRLKLAVVSAGLTFVILLLFAVVIGALTEGRVKTSFNDDLRATAADLQERFRIERNLDGDVDLPLDPETFEAAASGGAIIRVLSRDGQVLRSAPLTAPDLGPPVEGLRDVGEYRVVARPLFAGSLDRSGDFRLTPNPIDGAVAFVQYARPRKNLQSTVDKLHVFLALGIIGGTALAFLAGFAVARRAMRPIADLTRAAQEVARTRDPAMSLPRPEAKDEVARLAETLEEMLRELDAARGETESALDRQRQFVADASHELRTPLTSILANLELLEDELSRPAGARDDEAVDIAASALRSSRRMRRLVGDLLLLARADAGRRAQPRPVDMAGVVREAVAEAAPLASGHAVTLDLPDGPVTVEGSSDDLHRLVLNLVENALLHTPAGTPVVASARAEADSVVVEVADRGPGVPERLRERIFERFARREGDHGGGSGLGLAIVRAVAEAHGGSVEAREAEGGGAAFRVTLPSAAPLHSGQARVEADSETAPDEEESKSR